MASASAPDRPPVAPVRSFAPLVAPGARVLILGSMPGQASLTAEAYYAHPQNRFWPIMGAVLGFDATLPYALRCAALTRAGIALWDVLSECVRPGSLDAAIEAGSMRTNDIAGLLRAHPGITRILFNGTAAESIFRRHVASTLQGCGSPGLQRLPSTSPAHASLGYAEKLARWREALERA
ncbi:MAG: DNA-deoxyinosine glycosylase [Candidatus Dactylopiibacterium sp.]|nr:DNA-deoxyinosine glycosylase [Candidatus Dactylopiibacterium sp.]